MRLYSPKHSSGKSSIGTPKLSAHIVKPVKFHTSKVRLTAPKFSKGKAVKVKI